MEKRSSVLALIVSDQERAEEFSQTFEKLLEEHGPIEAEHTLHLFRFSSIGEFIKAQKQNKNLHATIIDGEIIQNASDIEKRAFELLEELQIPTLQVSNNLIQGDAAEKKILFGKWSQLMDQVRSFAPRGLRVHPRRICFVKVRYQRPGRRDGEETVLFPTETRAVTYDLSLGGCFIVSMDNWNDVDEVEIFVGDYPTPVPCKIAWKLPWGASPWKMPGIGVEFQAVSDQLKAYLINYLENNTQYDNG